MGLSQTFAVHEMVALFSLCLLQVKSRSGLESVTKKQEKHDSDVTHNVFDYGKYGYYKHTKITA